MADEYESQYMSDGRVLARDKQVAGLGMRLLMLIPTALFTLAAIAGAIGWIASSTPADMAFFKLAAIGAPMAALFGFMFVTGSVLRTVVSDTELWVHCGLVGSRIPLDKIKSCGVAEQHNRLRIGKRFENGHWTSSYLLRTGQYVEVIWGDDGKERRVVFSPEDPHAIVKAVQQARGLRIDTAEAAGRIEEDAPAVEADIEGETSTCSEEVPRARR